MSSAPAGARELVASKHGWNAGYRNHPESTVSAPFAVGSGSEAGICIVPPLYDMDLVACWLCESGRWTDGTPAFAPVRGG